jgi:membrane-bound serine protease (ClpP class)
MTSMIRNIFLAFLGFLLAPAAGWAQVPAALGSQVPVVEIQGAIGPASAAYFQRALDRARSEGAPLLVLRMDTPGGLDTAMREMIRGLLASPVPVAAFVAPSGARAASAGTYLMYASHVAAMAPGTNLGAATPVAIGIGGSPGAPPGGSPAEDKPEGESKEPKSGSAMEAKAKQDAAAYLRSLAQLRGRNVDWAEAAVMRSESLSAEEALHNGVIDLIAADVPDLLRKLDGRKVKVGESEQTLNLAGAAPVAIERNWKETLLAVISDPNVALILMMLGVYGLLFEFYSPGMGVPGVVGGICLLLALYSLALLPINFVGVALVLLGIGLMVAEAFMPSFGVLGIGGVVAFVAGALMLVDADVPGLQVSLSFVIPLAVASALVVAGIGAFALRARKRRPVAGMEGMIGGRAEALEDFEREGTVRAFGEIWRARTSAPLARGQKARVRAVDGLVLVLDPEPKGGGE